jgi:hypothetical protein
MDLPARQEHLANSVAKSQNPRGEQPISTDLTFSL